MWLWLPSVAGITECRIPYKEEHKCASFSGVNTVLTIFLVLHSLHTDVHDKKHSVAQYKGGGVWHGTAIFRDFFDAAIDSTAAPPVRVITNSSPCPNFSHASGACVAFHCHQNYCRNKKTFWDVKWNKICTCTGTHEQFTQLNYTACKFVLRDPNIFLFPHLLWYWKWLSVQ